MTQTEAFWAKSAQELSETLKTSPQGLSQDEARKRLLEGGPPSKKRQTTDWELFLNQFKSPIVLILLAAACLSFFLGDPTDAVIILVIVGASGILSWQQERGASGAVAKLLSLVQVKAQVIRENKPVEIPSDQVVPGDIVLLDAGDLIPGDGLLLEAHDLFVDEAALTGETFPVEKAPGLLPEETPLSKRTNALFLGTHVVSGTGKLLVVHTGQKTEFGAISERLRIRPPETEFERGIRHFGYLLMEVTLILVILIFAFNVFFHRPVLDSFLFALAIAVGLTPQLLPAIISVNLSHGARRMAQKKVIVKRLSAIENLGSMNVLCSDKTGTLTSGSVKLHSARDIEGKENAGVLDAARLNARFESGFANPLDQALRDASGSDLSAFEKADEIPYDFVRKRLSILVQKGTSRLMVTKGAFSQILDICTKARRPSGEDIPLDRDALEALFREFSEQGFRVLGVAIKEGIEAPLTHENESQMTFLGFLLFYDPPKPGVAETVRNLRDLGVSLKVITGDNALVAKNLVKQIGLPDPAVLTGKDLRAMSDAALLQAASKTHVFAEVEPNQKERILLSLKKAGNVVGFMGDGINDAPALHAADVGLSVDDAVDVAREAADLVLLERDLGVLSDGVVEGRKTFANTLKYVFMATSANFGNMFSMAGASVFLPFLPLLPTQILLMNLLTDLPEMTIANDRVDPEFVSSPHRWDIRFIKRFMVVFGLLSSVFDFLTFGVLLFLIHVTEKGFRTGWFLESVVSAAAIVLIVRTRRPFLKSRPGNALALATSAVILAVLVLPLTPLGALFQFVVLSPKAYLFIAGIIGLYILSAETAKRFFYKSEK